MRKSNILSLFFKILFLFVIIDFLLGIFPSLITTIISHSKYGLSIIAEIVAIAIALIVLSLAGNKYIFNTKREGFFKSLYVGLPMLIISIIYLFINSMNIILEGNFHIFNFFSLIFYCITIGIFEELLCRGWIQNEFIERYGNNRKQVITSIVLSAIIFGAMHITNIWSIGQDVYITSLQIINAIALGSFLGAVYYRTKNIWSVIFLHGFYDFSLMLSEINSLKDCTVNEATTKIMIYQALAILVMALMFTICTSIILRKSKLNPLLKEPTPLSKMELIAEKRNTIILIICAILINFCPLPSISKEESDNYQTCYEYDEVQITDFEIKVSNHTQYNIEYTISDPIFEYINNVPNNEWIDRITEETTDTKNKPQPGTYKYSIAQKEKSIIIKNTTTQEEVPFDLKTQILGFTVINNNNKTKIAILTYENNNSIIYYSDYINNENLSNDITYLYEIIDSFKRIISPDSKILGTITTSDISYPYIQTINGEKLLIDNNKLFIIK